MTTTETVHIEADLSPAQALAFAQFLKRAGHGDYLRCAVDKQEAHEMLDASYKLQKGFAQAGYAPR